MIQDYLGKTFSVLGLGKSGFESALFLNQRGARVFVSELQSSEILVERKRRLEEARISVELGKHSVEDILDSDAVIISPGISPHSDIYQKVRASQMPLWSEIELAFRHCPAPVIAVTGSNGKTTVTTLIAQMFKDQGLHAISCGNIGNPFVGEVERVTAESLVILEVSSFQLENIATFRPKVAILLNLSSNHFDWHGDFERYVKAKMRIFENQTLEDFAILNGDDTEVVRRSADIKATRVFFESKGGENPNFKACLQVSAACGLKQDATEKTLLNFNGIEHRMEELKTSDGIRYINDSKSTTIASLKWALDRMNKKVVLIMGGRHKGGDFSEMKEMVVEKVGCLIVLGEASRLIESKFFSMVPIIRAESLKGAVESAQAVARPGDTVLFSPACASFDMFRNYEDRGQQFKQIVSGMQERILELVERDLNRSHTST